MNVPGQVAHSLFSYLYYNEIQSVTNASKSSAGASEIFHLFKRQQSDYPLMSFLRTEEQEKPIKVFIPDSADNRIFSFLDSDDIQHYISASKKLSQVTVRTMPGTLKHADDMYARQYFGEVSEAIAKRCMRVGNVRKATTPFEKRSFLNGSPKVVLLRVKDQPRQYPTWVCENREITRLDVRGASKINAYRCLKALPQFLNLTHLNLTAGWNIEDHALELIKKSCVMLRWLDISGTRITNVECLATLTKLEELTAGRLRGTRPWGVIGWGVLLKTCTQLEVIDVTDSHLNRGSILILRQVEEDGHLTVLPEQRKIWEMNLDLSSSDDERPPRVPTRPRTNWQIQERAELSTSRKNNKKNRNSIDVACLSIESFINDRQLEEFYVSDGEEDL